jgi:apolipoprotein N-acyltransferase
MTAVPQSEPALVSRLPRLGDGLALAAGALLPFAYAPYGWWWLAVLAPAVLFAAWDGLTPRRALWRGWLFGLGLFGVGTSWVHISINQFGGVVLPLAVAATALFVMGVALFPALLGWLANRLTPEAGALRWLLALPGGWTLAEWVRGWFFTGFPWLNLGYSQLETPLAGFAPVAGVYGVSLAAAVSAGALVYAARSASLPKGLYTVAGLALLWGGGGLIGQVQWVQPAGAPVRVSLVQGNIAQDLKWLQENQQPTLELYRELTRMSRDSDLVVWPETAVPAFLHQVEGFLEELAEEARAYGTDLLVGVPVYELATDRYYNSVMSLGSATGFYHKRHLVPFGEYLPLKRALSGLLGFLEVPMSDFSAGAPVQAPLEVAGLRAGVLICYEAAFGEEVIAALPGADVLVNVSNDAWFGDSLAPHQHLQKARMRALETGRYLLRATNTGISAIIGPDGGLAGVSPQFEVHVLTGSVRPMQGATPYVSVGNAPVVLLAGLAVGLAALLGPRGLGLTRRREDAKKAV